LGQEAVDANSINAFKSKLDRLRCVRIGFFHGLVRLALGLLVESLLARPHKVCEYESRVKRPIYLLIIDSH